MRGDQELDLVAARVAEADPLRLDGGVLLEERLQFLVGLRARLELGQGGLQVLGPRQPDPTHARELEVLSRVLLDHLLPRRGRGEEIALLVHRRVEIGVRRRVEDALGHHPLADALLEVGHGAHLGEGLVHELLVARSVAEVLRAQLPLQAQGEVLVRDRDGLALRRLE